MLIVDRIKFFVFREIIYGVFLLEEWKIVYRRSNTPHRLMILYTFFFFFFLILVLKITNMN